MISVFTYLIAFVLASAWIRFNGYAAFPIGAVIVLIFFPKGNRKSVFWEVLIGGLLLGFVGTGIFLNLCTNPARGSLLYQFEITYRGIFNLKERFMSKMRQPTNQAIDWGKAPDESEFLGHRYRALKIPNGQTSPFSIRLGSLDVPYSMEFVFDTNSIAASFNFDPPVGLVQLKANARREENWYEVPIRPSAQVEVQGRSGAIALGEDGDAYLIRRHGNEWRLYASTDWYYVLEEIGASRRITNQ